MKRSLALVVFAGALGGQALAQDVLKIAVPQRGAWDTSITELGNRAGIFKKHGLTLEILWTQGGAESIQAVIAGSMDIATAAGVASALSTYAKGAPVRIIGSEMIGSPDLYWYVPANSPIRKLEDINDKTIGYSVAGSSSHAALLELLTQHNIKAKLVSTGGMQGTVTQTMTGQIDVGWAAAPFGLDMLEQGRIRIVARGSDINALKGRTVRVNVANLQTIERRKDAVARFMQGTREAIDWLYNDPAALKMYGEFSNLPDSVVQRVRDFVPKETMTPDRIVGMDQVIADAVKFKFIPAPLTAEQVKELVQIPPPMK
jgi:NitT/TauT family transport system substrate-binding protein